MLLVESGSRNVLEAAIPRLASVFGTGIAFDLITCLPNAPKSSDGFGKIWRTQDHSSTAARKQLVQDLQGTDAAVLAIVCSGEPIMTRWKWWLAWHLPLKILIINENSDFFWLDSSNLPVIRRMAFIRSGLGGGSSAAAVFRLGTIPFTALYLVLYATIVHTKRALRVGFAHRK